MKLITLWEPWATLMAIGAKKIETRHWSTPYRGWLAIHAAKHWTGEERFLCSTEPFCGSLSRAGIHSGRGGFGDGFRFGCIIAIAKLVDCRRIGGDEAYRIRPDFFMLPPEGNEFHFGNYEPGRYGLITERVFRLPRPIPFKSRQGMLLEVPPEIVAEIQQQWREAA